MTLEHLVGAQIRAGHSYEKLETRTSDSGESFCKGKVMSNFLFSIATYLYMLRTLHSMFLLCHFTPMPCGLPSTFSYVYQLEQKSSIQSVERTHSLVWIDFQIKLHQSLSYSRLSVAAEMIKSRRIAIREQLSNTTLLDAQSL